MEVLQTRGSQISQQRGLRGYQVRSQNFWLGNLQAPDVFETLEIFLECMTTANL